MNITHEDLTRVEGKIDVLLEMLDKQGHAMETPTLGSLKDQLDRIESLLAGTMPARVMQANDSMTACLLGGSEGLRELNKRRRAEGRKKK